MPAQMRILRPAPHIWAFYDGRVPGYRFAPGPNWVDDGALSLGIASYAVVDGAEALIYDTHCSVPHARLIRDALKRAGVRHFTIVLSHWHLDHVAGTEVFADCRIIANRRTADLLNLHRAAIESGTSSGSPAHAPPRADAKSPRSGNGPHTWCGKGRSVSSPPLPCRSFAPASRFSCFLK